MRRTAITLVGLVALSVTGLLTIASPTWGDAWFHSAAAEKALESLWTNIIAGGAGAGGAATGALTTDNALVRANNPAGVTPNLLQGGPAVEDDNGGIDIPAHATNGGKLTLKEGADDGTNTLSIGIPDVGGIDRDVAVTATAHGGLDFVDPRSYLHLTEDFLAPTVIGNATDSGPLHLKWQVVGTACANPALTNAPSFDRPGIMRFGTDAILNDVCELIPNVNVTQNTMVGMSTNLGWAVEGSFKIVDNATVAIYFGLGLAANVFPTDEFMGIRFDTSADGTTFKCLGITGSVAGATTNIAVTADTATYHYFRVEHDPAASAGTAQIKCTVDSTSVAGVTDHVPGAGVFSHFYFAIKSLQAVTSKFVDFDWVSLMVPVNR